MNSSTKKSKAKHPSSTPSRNSGSIGVGSQYYHFGTFTFSGRGPKLNIKKTRVICIIRKVATWNPINTGQMYWATLRYAHIYNSKTPRDDMFNSPYWTWALDTESVGSVREAKAIARGYAKKLGLRIAKYDERL